MFSNVMRIDFTRDYGNWSENLVAIFNSKKVSEDEVLRIINTGDPYHPDIMIVYPEQWDSVFSKEDNDD